MRKKLEQRGNPLRLPEFTNITGCITVPPTRPGVVDLALETVTWQNGRVGILYTVTQYMRGMAPARIYGYIRNEFAGCDRPHVHNPKAGFCDPPTRPIFGVYDANHDAVSDELTLDEAVDSLLDACGVTIDPLDLDDPDERVKYANLTREDIPPDMGPTVDMLRNHVTRLHIGAEGMTRVLVVALHEASDLVGVHGSQTHEGGPRAGLEHDAAVLEGIIRKLDT